MTTSGWVRENGLDGHDGEDQFGFVGSFPPEPIDLAGAIAQGAYLSISVSPATDHALDIRGAGFGFTIERIDFHSPTQYFVMSSIDGFTESDVLLQTLDFQDQTPIDFELVLPFDGFLTEQTIEFRIYTVGGQFDGHRAALNAFRLNGAAVTDSGDLCWAI